MKFQAAFFLSSISATMASRPLRTSPSERDLVIANCPGSAGDFDVAFTGECIYDNLSSAIATLMNTTYPDCTATVDAVTLDLLGTDAAGAEAKVATLCAAAYANTDLRITFDEVTLEGYQFNNEYYSGGTTWNYEIETNAGENVLRTDAGRVKKIYEHEAQYGIIDLPMDLPAFNPKGVQDCELNAAFCCWVQDRQAGDGNGNCATPYDERCYDSDPGDNANLCYVDHTHAASVTHIAGGYSIYGDPKTNSEAIEGPVHCHGFAWADDETDPISIYKGNNLFYVSMYDHMHQRGYVRNVPGSTMCSCAENMPVVTRSDCTELAITETFSFAYTTATSTLSATLDATDVNFNACQGAGGKNNDLEAYYEKLVAQGKATAANLATLQTILVGATAGQCDAAIESFLATKGITVA